MKRKQLKGSGGILGSQLFNFNLPSFNFNLDFLQFPKLVLPFPNFGFPTIRFCMGTKGNKNHKSTNNRKKDNQKISVDNYRYNFCEGAFS